MKKGLSLPIEMIIIISICVIVLLAAVSFFFSGILSGQKSISDADAGNRACAIIQNRGCQLGDDLSAITIARYDYNSDGVEDTVSDACRIYYGSTTDDDCINYCCASVGKTASESRG